MADYTPKQLASVDAAYWAILSKIKLANGQFTFDGREYLLEPMRSTDQRRCFMKGTQGGASLIVMLGVGLHGPIFGYYPNGVLYLMPTKDDVLEYSTTKFDPLIKMNSYSVGRYVKAGGKGADTKSLKRIGETAYLYFRSGTLPKKIEVGYQESSSLKGITVDAVVFDEIDVMDEEVRAKALGRMYASDKKHEIYIGNPGIPNKGIDAIMKESDNRHWFMRCNRCTAETCAQYQFFEDAGKLIKMRDDGTSYLSCYKCGSEIFVKDGHWVPDSPEKTSYMVGWNWSGLILPGIQPHEILHDFQFPPNGNLGDVMRTRLGVAYINEEDALTKQQVFSCCGDRMMESSSDGPCAAGVDVGDFKHVVIGGRVGSTAAGLEKFDILKITKEKSWDRIFDTFRRFNVKSAVVDLRPMADAARAFQARCKKVGITVFLCEYSDNTPLGTQYNKNTGLVKVNRTEILDMTGTMTRNQEYSLPRRSPTIEEFADQMTDPTCVEEIDKRAGKIVRRYKGNNDHYRHAMNYFRLAATGSRVGLLEGGKMVKVHRQKYATVNRRRAVG